MGIVVFSIRTDSSSCGNCKNKQELVMHQKSKNKKKEQCVVKMIIRVILDKTCFQLLIFQLPLMLKFVQYNFIVIIVHSFLS